MMRYALLCSLAAAGVMAFPAIAREPESAREPAKPVTEKNVSAADVVTTPLSDLNLRKGEIPPVLIEAGDQAYSLDGASTCQQLSATVTRLDAALGEDIDLPQAGGQRTSGGRMAQSVVGSFIPFRGLIREVSGASGRERELQAAILAGVARRAFLKGVGQARGCRYPARSAPLTVYNQRLAELTGDQPAAADGTSGSGKSP